MPRSHLLGEFAKRQQCLDFTISTHLAASNNPWFSFHLKSLSFLSWGTCPCFPLVKQPNACMQGETCILCRVQHRIFLLKNHTRLIFAPAADGDLPPPETDARDEVPRRASTSLMACKRHLWHQVRNWWGNPELSKLMREESLHDQ